MILPALLAPSGIVLATAVYGTHGVSGTFGWAGIDRATSHSGRRTLATKLLHEYGEHRKTVQPVLGHESATEVALPATQRDDQRRDEEDDGRREQPEQGDAGDWRQ